MVLYTRPGCHLCDVARRRSCPTTRFGFEFDEVDIEADDELELEYGIRIPVVEVDGEEAFEVTVDAAARRALVTRSAGARELVNAAHFG